MKNVDVARELISETLRQSTLILSVFMFFVMIIITLFGCIIYLCEGGTYTVNSLHPLGAYLRLTDNGSDLEITPFVSIPVGMYWVIGTAAGAGERKHDYVNYMNCTNIVRTFDEHLTKTR